jgi:hypothetical protein
MSNQRSAAFRIVMRQLGHRVANRRPILRRTCMSRRFSSGKASHHRQQKKERARQHDVQLRT